MIDFKYYEDRLNTNDPYRILTQIKRAKAEIKRLKRILENPDYENRTCPQEDVFLTVEQSFLIQAIAKYISLGGEYKKDKEELQEEEFNQDLKNIEKIEISFKGFYCLEKTAEMLLAEDRPRLFIDGYEMLINEQGLYSSRKRILSGIERVQVGAWKKHYCLAPYKKQVLDGEEWKVVFRYKNKKVRQYGGYCVFPWSFSEFLEVINLSDTDFDIRKKDK